MRMISLHLVLALGETTTAMLSADYVIIGGGTAGLTIASRLSEDPDLTVAVLEAGEDRSDDVNVLSPGLLTNLYANPLYDWDYHTVPQTHAGNHVIAHPRGKQLGGSSAINFLWWTHASQQDIDNWGLLGNANWSWQALEHCYTRSERFVAPSTSVEQDLQTQDIDPDLHGHTGEVFNTFPPMYSQLDEAWPRTYQTLGLAVDGDPRDGLALGGYTNLVNMDLSTKSRSYAATTYLRNARGRSNLRVLTGAHVEKILFDKSFRDPRAVGVQYSRNSTREMIKATKEIILSAGAFGSPQILELSGIGSRAILETHGIATVVANDNVGENLQDHAYVPLGWQVKEPGIFTLDDLANETLFDQAYDQYIGNRTGWLATTSAMSALLSLRQIVDRSTARQLGLFESIRTTCSDLIRDHHETQPESLDQQTILCRNLESEAVAQEFGFPGGISPQLSNDSSKVFFANIPGNFFSMSGVLEHPFSRGSIHIQSANSSVYPRVDPDYLSNNLDVKLLSVIALHAQKIATTKPLSDLLVDNGTAFQPGFYELNAANVEAWIRDTLQSEHHLCRTCAMLPREKGGVVDERFQVHGVDRLRVVDASIFPLIPRANLQTLVYAVAERAVEFIREDVDRL